MGLALLKNRYFTESLKESSSIDFKSSSNIYKMQFQVNIY